MSRIGARPIEVPESIEVQINNDIVTVSGPRGTLSRAISPKIEIQMKERVIVLTPRDKGGETRAIWGTYAAHIRNMIRGVSSGFEKKLMIEGIGYRAAVEGKTLALSVGFSHQVKFHIPEGITVSSEKGVINVSGFDKERVGLFAAQVRDVKKPEPYKGKGIRYENEIIKRKQGKKAVT